MQCDSSRCVDREALPMELVHLSVCLSVPERVESLNVFESLWLRKIFVVT